MVRDGFVCQHMSDISLSVIYADVSPVVPNEIEVNKILTNKDHYIQKGFNPTISMALKAGRTVYCSNFDLALLQTYDADTIKGLLKGKGWAVIDIYIMKNKSSFKIEFESSDVAIAFMNDTNTEVGGIKLLNSQKEPEVDRTIIQCWKCGMLNPDHLTQNCTRDQQCLKCGESDHQFFDCHIPKLFTDMNSRDKAARHCISCGTFGNHTSLDYSTCPKIKEIVQKRIQDSREKRMRQLHDNQRDLTLMKSAMLDFTSTVDWPIPHQKEQQKQISTIVMLTLLDEAVNPGSFQDNLSKACQDNGLPDIKYDLKPNTAQSFFEACTGQISIRSKRAPKKMKSTLSKYSRDQLKNLGQNYYSSDSDTDTIIDSYPTTQQRALNKIESKPVTPISDSMTFSIPPQDHKRLLPDTPLSLDLCNDSGRTVDLDPEYLRHLQDLDSRIQTKVKDDDLCNDSHIINQVSHVTAFMDNDWYHFDSRVTRSNVEVNTD